MKQRKHKQIAAICCIVLLVLLYVAALVAALLDKSASGQWFKLCMIGTIVLPVVTWVYIWLYGAVTGKKTIADLHLMEDGKEASGDLGNEDSKDV